MRTKGSKVGAQPPPSVGGVWTGDPLGDAQPPAAGPAQDRREWEVLSGNCWVQEATQEAGAAVGK